jgi:hypothetical protein
LNQNRHQVEQWTLQQADLQVDFEVISKLSSKMLKKAMYFQVFRTEKWTRILPESHRFYNRPNGSLDASRNHPWIVC